MPLAESLSCVQNIGKISKSDEIKSSGRTHHYIVYSCTKITYIYIIFKKIAIHFIYKGSLSYTFN